MLPILAVLIEMISCAYRLLPLINQTGRYPVPPRSGLLRHWMQL